MGDFLPAGGHGQKTPLQGPQAGVRHGKQAAPEVAEQVRTPTTWGKGTKEPGAQRPTGWGARVARARKSSREIWWKFAHQAPQKWRLLSELTLI